MHSGRHYYYSHLIYEGIEIQVSKTLDLGACNRPSKEEQLNPPSGMPGWLSG